MKCGDINRKYSVLAMNPIDVMHAYWSELFNRVQTIYTDSQRARYIVRKCFGTEHTLRILASKKVKLHIMLNEAFLNYRNVYSCPNLRFDSPILDTRTLNHYSVPHQNALYRDDMEFLTLYLNTYKQLLAELMAQSDFLKPYIDFGLFFLHCKRTIHCINSMYDTLEMVRVIDNPPNPPMPSKSIQQV